MATITPSEHWQQALHLFKTYIGIGIPTEAEMDEMCASDDWQLAYRECPATGEMLGAGTCRIARSVDVLPAKIQNTIANPEANLPIGLLNGVVVKPEARGQGIGRALRDERIEWMQQEGCTQIVSLAVRAPKMATSIFLLEEAGFKTVAEFSCPWKKACMQQPGTCGEFPTDGSHACVCDGVAMVLEL